MGNDSPQQWVHMAEDELEEVCAGVRDSALKHTLQFGIGLHHAGLNDRDRTLVETLFVEGAIQVTKEGAPCCCLLHSGGGWCDDKGSRSSLCLRQVFEVWVQLKMN